MSLLPIHLQIWGNWKPRWPSHSDHRDSVSWSFGPLGREWVGQDQGPRRGLGRIPAENAGIGVGVGVSMHAKTFGFPPQWSQL